MKLAMPVYIALLRGVNVVGNNKIKMDQLRLLFDSIGLKQALTYIQSGNVLFKSKDKDSKKLEGKIETAIEKRFGFRPRVIVRVSSQLDEVIERNPFAARTDIEPNKLLVTFLATDPGEDVRRKVREIKGSPEELYIDGCEMFTYYPDGVGQSKLPVKLIEKTLGTPGTARNWNTLLKLREMSKAMESKPDVTGITP